MHPPWGDDETKPDTLALLESIRRYADRTTLYCHAGGIGPLAEYPRLLSFAEDSLVQVAPRTPGHLFHPKLWALRFKRDGTRLHRLLVSSRNLADDRSWDTLLVLDEDTSGEGIDGTPAAEFVRSLPSLALGHIAPGRADQAADLARTLTNVRFKPPDPFTAGTLWPLGLTGTNGWPMPPEPDRALVISPFLDAQAAGRARARVRPVFVSRAETYDRVGGRTFSHADVRVLSPHAETEFTDQSPGNPDRPSEVRSGLHAKVTAGTSFQLGNSGGQAPERALLFVMLRELWGRRVLASPKWVKVFQGNASEARMRYEMGQVDRKDLGPDLIDALRIALETELHGQQLLVDALSETVDRFGYLRPGKSVPAYVSQQRFRLIGQLRQILARICVTHLDPDLVILDEFQRFSQLFSGTDEASLLVQELLGPIEVEQEWKHRRARTLLLSATPFKMYTLPDEPEGDDHYEDFLRTVRFLSGDERAGIVRDALSEMRLALVQGNHDAAGSAKEAAERELRRVMARTERLAVSSDRDGMLAAKEALIRVTTSDVRDYLDQSAVARALGSPDVLEYWRSSPYVFELMERYHVKRRIEEALADGTGMLDGLLRSKILPEDIDRFGAVDLGNPRARWLAQDVLGTGAWRAAWLPPALPYYSPREVYAESAFQQFTKRLVFSAWSVVPKAIATSLSYEVERRLAERSPTMRSRGYFATRRRGLLNFVVAEGRPAGMPALALIYPCVTLARVGDPRRVAAERGRTLPMDRDELVTHVRSRVEGLLSRLPAGHEDRVPDQRWYWAAPFLLDRVEAGLGPQGLPFGTDAGDETARGFRQHVEEAHRISGDHLGPRPDDLADVLAELAIAGPGACALRTLAGTVARPNDLELDDLRKAASRWGWSLRALFNGAEIMAVLEGEGTRTGGRSCPTRWTGICKRCWMSTQKC